MKTRQSGFTLIELVVVITILGILAAVAVPKFISLQGDARLAKMNAAVGSMKAAAAMAHGALIARGFPSTFTGTPAPAIVIEGTTVVYANGYPDANVIAAISGITPQDYNIPPAGGTTQQINADANHTSCNFTYTEALPNQQPTYTTTNLTLANCS